MVKYLYWLFLHSLVMDYASLRQEIIDAGLLERQYGYYTFKIASTLGLLAVSIFVLMRVDSFAIQLFNSVFLAFVFVQIAMLMHDANHQEIFNSGWKNDVVGLIAGNLMISISSSSWKNVHGRHHSAPNVIDHDPDIDIPVLAHSEDQALNKKGVAKFIVKRQAYLWFPIVSLAAFATRLNHFRQVVLKLAIDRQNIKYYITEALLLFIGAMIYFGLVFNFLTFGKAVIFILTNYLLMGFYMSTVFATNHKGMPIMKEKSDFLHMQVLTARDVRGSPVIDFWCGCLNYQIEHHLFPTMPRNNLSKAKSIVKAFCQKHGINYHESGFFQSYKEILQHIRNVSAVLRKTKTGEAVNSMAKSSS